MISATFPKVDLQNKKATNTNMIGERALSNEEIRRAKELQTRIIPAEDKAFEFFPVEVRTKVVRNIPVAFLNHSAYYPDFLLSNEKILIEIDDWQHDYLPRKAKDEHRDKVFSEHGYRTIRIKDKFLKDEKKFLAILYLELVNAGFYDDNIEA